MSLVVAEPVHQMLSPQLTICIRVVCTTAVSYQRPHDKSVRTIKASAPAKRLHCKSVAPEKRPKGWVFQACLECLVLEGMRHLTHDGSGNLADLIKDHQTERNTLGILLTMPTQNSRTPRGVRPETIRDLTVGGPATLSGMVRVGDEIVAVEGTAVHDTESVSTLVRGSDDIGTMSFISLLRNGEMFDVELIRDSSTRMRTVEKLFKLINSAEAQARNGRIESVLQDLLLIVDALSTSENARMHRESRLVAHAGPTVCCSVVVLQCV